MIFAGAAAAVVAGALFALAAVLQQKMAAQRPAGEQMSPRLLLHLARERTWLAGIAVAAGSYVVQALALSLAPLSVVQPLLTAEVIFAVPLSVRRHHISLVTREWSAIVGVTVALAAGLVAAAPQPGHPVQPLLSWAPVLGGVVGTALAAIAAARLLHGRGRAAGYAVAAAMVMGLEASLMAATAAQFSHGIGSGFSSWEPYAMGASSITVLLLVQSAFAAGPLAVSMPVTDALSPAAAIVIGVTLFGERINTSPWRVAIAVVAALVVVAAILVLDTSRVVRAVHQRENEETEGQPETEPVPA